MITLKEIAQMAGVSRGTVDRVLNHRGGVSEETAMEDACRMEHVISVETFDAMKKHFACFHGILPESEIWEPESEEDGISDVTEAE